jgi:hypothetical protein
MLRLYHRTTKSAAQSILRDGFQDREGSYGTEQVFRGVWLSLAPLDASEGATGDTLLAVDLRLELGVLAEYEWTEEGKTYREWLIPAHVINGNSRVTIVLEE